MFKIQLLFGVLAWVLLFFSLIEAIRYEKFSNYLLYLSVFLFSFTATYNALYNPLYDGDYCFVAVFKGLIYALSAIGLFFSIGLFLISKEDLGKIFK